MKNLSGMVDEVAAYLRSFVRDQELSTHLTQDVTFGDLKLPVADPTVISRGRIQINDELIWVDKSDRATSVADIPPYGRGMDSTNAENHKAGTRVIMNPLYPRQTIKDTINQSIAAVGSQLYGVDTVEFTGKNARHMYDMPAFTRDVLAVKVANKNPGLYNQNVTVLRDWQFDKQAPITASQTGKSLYLDDGWVSSQELIHVTFSRDPAELLFAGQMFEETYLPSTAWDVIVLLAASRLMATAEASDISTRSIEATNIDPRQATTQGQRQSQYLYNLSQQRLAEERMRLLNSTVNRTHYAR